MKLNSFLSGTLILALVLLIVYVIIVILPTFLFEGYGGVSNGIAESKRNGVFLHEYTIEPEVLQIDSTFTIRLGESWAEKTWVQGNYFNPVKEPSRDDWKGFTLYIEIIGSSNFIWAFFEKYSIYARENETKIIGFATKCLGGVKCFLTRDSRELENEMIIYIEAEETDSTKSDLRKTFFTIRKK